MNEFIKVLKERRSVRSFTDEVISEDLLNAVLEAGMNAPSGMNKQPAIMVAVQDPVTIETLRHLNANVIGDKESDPFYGAKTVIVVLADKNSRTFVEDGSLVMGNLLNAAYSLGLGACWIHRAKEVFETDEGKALLKNWGVKGKYQGIGHCILGYPANGFPPEKQKRKIML